MAAWDKLVLEQLLCSVLSVDSNAPLLSKEVVTSALGKDQNTAMQDLLSNFRCNTGVNLLFFIFKRLFKIL